MFLLLIEPFTEFDFMRRALVACVVLTIGAGPVGVLLLLRRMSLVGDAMAHAVLPGAALGFMIAGPSLLAMTIGGGVAGLLMAALAGVVSRRTLLREDASFSGFYLCALALGVLLVSLRGSQIDVLHLLFGSVLAIDGAALLLMGSITSISTLLLLLFYRPLVLEAFDPHFLQTTLARGARQRAIYHTLFLLLVVLNMVAAFQTLGTMLALGLMMLPAATARLHCATLPAMMACATLYGLLASAAGLLISYYSNAPSGAAIVLCAGFVYAIALLVAGWNPAQAAQR